MRVSESLGRRIVGANTLVLVVGGAMVSTVTYSGSAVALAADSSSFQQQLPLFLLPSQLLLSVDRQR
jgi:hypothetical protein